MPPVLIVSPSLADANNGNWRTAERWRQALSAAPALAAEIRQAWSGEPVDAVIALHARRSAASIDAFHAAHPERGLAVVLTGTDLYPSLDAVCERSLAQASHIVVLQKQAWQRLPPALRGKARVILPSAPRVDAARDARWRTVVIVGHLREEKDPHTLWAAVAALADLPRLRVVHIGRALDERLAAAAREMAARHPHYHWLGALPAHEARDWIARADVLVNPSRVEGAPTVVIEALRSGVPVIASRIDGHLGLLGPQPVGGFAPGDAEGLAALVRRFFTEPAFADPLCAEAARREPLFDPRAEAEAVRALGNDLVAHSGKGALRQ